MAKAAEAVETAIAAEAKLDAHKLRADFPIFQQRFHGKPLAYLDSAVSAQKPWLNDWRRRLADVRLRGLECFAASWR